MSLTLSSETLGQGLAVLHALLRERGFATYAPGSELQPALVALHPAIGLVAIDVAHTSTEPRKSLNRKVANLREQVPSLARTQVHRRVIVIDASQGDLYGDGLFLTPESATQLTWLDALAPLPAPTDAARHLSEAYEACFEVAVPSRPRLADPDTKLRELARVRLDAEQSRVAHSSDQDVLVVTGTAGSGKTLVLIARARWLAENNPGWTIQVLCFNRLLVPYLKAQVADLPNVRVNTFGKFAHQSGYTVSLSDEAAAARQVRSYLERVEPTVDAVLVDEWQDFMPAWTELILALVRDDRGGAALAGDPQQALYRESPELPANTASGTSAGASLGWGLRRVRTVQLRVPYRSTRQILQVTSALDPSFVVEGMGHALEGQPVDLVWADSPKAQAEAIARDITLLLQDGQRELDDIAVLVTRKWNIGQLAGALSDVGIPFRVVHPNQADGLELSVQSVTIMTVHSAKGYEFPVVFLMGLEHLSKSDGSTRARQDGRTGYVGMTRAKDHLVLTYTRDSQYLERLRTVPEDALRSWVWPDDYLQE